jgi:hypothetical protein
MWSKRYVVFCLIEAMLGSTTSRGCINQGISGGLTKLAASKNCVNAFEPYFKTSTRNLRSELN